MTPEKKKNILIFVVAFNFIIGLGLQFVGVQLISNNDRKLGYFCMTLGLIILAVNAVIAIWKINK